MSDSRHTTVVVIALIVAPILLTAAFMLGWWTR